jgi:hypothetical protein
MANLESLLLVVIGTIGAMIGIFEIVYIAKTKQVVSNSKQVVSNSKQVVSNSKQVVSNSKQVVSN